MAGRNCSVGGGRWLRAWVPVDGRPAGTVSLADATSAPGACDPEQSSDLVGAFVRRTIATVWAAHDDPRSDEDRCRGHLAPRAVGRIDRDAAGDGDRWDDDCQLMADLGLSSLALVEVCCTIRDGLGVDPLDAAAAGAVGTVGDLVHLVHQLVVIAGVAPDADRMANALAWLA